MNPLCSEKWATHPMAGVLSLLLWIVFPHVALAETSTPSRSAIHELLTQLNDKDRSKVADALDQLHRSGSPLAIPYVWKLFESGDGIRRKLAMDFMRKVKAPTHAIRLLAESLADPLLVVRRASAEALAATAGRDEAIQAYLKALDQPQQLSPLGRFRAVQLITHLGGEDAITRLKTGLKDTDPDIAGAAAEGLAVQGDLHLARPLIEALGKINHPEVRPAIVDALRALTGKDHGANLVKWEEWSNELDQDRPDVKLEEQISAKSKSKDGAFEPVYMDVYKEPVQKSPVDFVVVFDTTGSMTHIWPEVGVAIGGVLREMSNRTPSLRIGSIRYRADDPRRSLNYMLKPFPLTRDLEKAVDSIKDATFGGGSGGLHKGLMYAINAFSWRANARKIVLIVGDTTPGGNGFRDARGVIREGWELDKIQFNALFVRSIHGQEHKSTYQTLAEAGGGCFYEYNKRYSRLLDLSDPAVDPKKVELPEETLKKWLTPNTKAAPK